ncbi:MAG: cytochrome c [Gemmatimonadota bacterium]
MSRISRTTVAVAITAIVGLGAPEAASAQDAPAEVTYRQNIMQAIRTNIQQLRAVGNVDQPTHTVHYARALYGIGEMLGDAFENGSAANSGALPTVWQNRAQFNEHVTGFEEATAQLLEAAEMRDQAGITAGVQAVGGTCSSCHQEFRAPN